MAGEHRGVWADRRDYIEDWIIFLSRNNPGTERWNFGIEPRLCPRRHRWTILLVDTQVSVPLPPEENPLYDIPAHRYGTPAWRSSLGLRCAARGEGTSRESCLPKKTRYTTFPQP